MAQEGYKRKLAAILSADVVGYSRLMGQDEAATVATITAYREVITNLIRRHDGRVVDAKGDNVLAAFESVVDAVQCAVEIQTDLNVQNADLPADRRMEFRIGINLGDVIEEEGTIYGDGVNIAARIESLTKAGGICISGTSYDQVVNKLGLEYEFLGEQEVKNIERPIRLYRVLSFPGAAAHRVVQAKEAVGKRWRKLALVAVPVVVVAIIAFVVWNSYFRLPSIAPASVEKMAFQLPDKPSIAVLPFVNMSGDPEQDSIALGISENIITALSMIPELFVISRSSAFTYKGKSVKIQQVAEELGVRYVLEGSLQRTDDQVRVTAQLIDALGGHHLWADRYDRSLQNLFVLQDEIAKKIAIELQVKISEGEIARISQRTDNFEAWGYAVRAYSLSKKSDRESVHKAKKLSEKAISIDPDYGYPWGILGTAHLVDAVLGYSESPNESLKLFVEYNKKALRLDPTLSCALANEGHVYSLKRQFDKAVIAGEKAIAMHPNDDLPYYSLAYTMRLVGRFDEAITLIKKAMRHNPYYPPFYLGLLASLYKESGRYEEALVITQKLFVRAQKGEYPLLFSHIHFSSTYMLLGREKEATAHASEVLRIDPNWSLERLRKQYSMHKDPAYYDFIFDALRKSGLPDKSPLPLPDKPSIAVLPFTNMSDDPKQEYFSDGITEDIITALSKVPNLFVIARNSTFTYKGKPVKVQQVMRELGVRYVLEGSVQKSAEKLRITAQLVDAKSGHHLWADRYDREMKDIFALQDEITIKVLTAMQVKLTEGKAARVYGRGTKNLEAYIMVLQGREYAQRFNREGNALAQKMFEESIALDPEYAMAYWRLSATHLMDLIIGSTNSPQQSLEQAEDLAYKALDLDGAFAEAHALLGRIYLTKEQYEKAIEEGERALTLDPNSYIAQYALAFTLSYSGRAQEAIALYKKAIRVNPIPPSSLLTMLGSAYRSAGRYEEAISTYKKGLHINPSDMFAHLGLASVYSLLGRKKDARDEATEVLKIDPKFSLINMAKQIPYKDTADRERLIEALRKAGLK